MRYLVVLFVMVFVRVNAQSKTADAYFATGNYTKAIAAYTNCKTCQVKNTYPKIAQSYVLLGNFAAAKTFYEKALKVDSSSALVQYNYAKLLTRLKQFDSAKTVYKTLIQTDSLNPNYYYQLGELLYKTKDSLYYKQFETAIQLDSSHQNALFKLAKHYLKKRKFNKTHQLTNIGLHDYKHNVALISLKAQAFYHQDDFLNAITWFEKLIALGEKSEFIYEKLSISYAKNSDYNKAIFYRKEALKYNPNNANAMLVIGEYYKRLSDFENAEIFLTKALKLLNKSLAYEYRVLGTVYNHQKKYKQAIKALNIALKEDPTDALTAFYLLNTKTKYYADIDTKIKLHERFIETYKNTGFVKMIAPRLKKLKEEQFLNNTPK